ncbi:MFS transporter [Oceanobacillus chungangensis]|uniref:MFS transporter n=1 Tax=Oceanobacillus chungangensis TaxID=1229152 RepID=A0A3D8PUF1_9BACI|nr:MFS transporter [Oceanobacillus chungangensis]RDW19743.1 MFS transporter [Oceanobacillus chungangensis]
MKAFHKGWFVLFIGVLNLLAFLGLGRFSLGTIFPFMKAGLDLTYSEIGIVSSAIFLGYVISASLAGNISVRFSLSAKKMIVFSLILTCAGMFAGALSFNFLSAFCACFLIGIGAGIGNTITLSLIGNWFSPKRKGMAIGIAYSGAGLGMAVSGFVVPIIISLNIDKGWQISWYTMGAVVLIIIPINLLFLNNTPEEVGLKPIDAKNNTELLLHANTELQHDNKEKNVYKNKTIWMTGMIYMAWGFSYIMFSTFLVDYLMKEIHLDKEAAGSFFAFAGLGSIISGYIWGHISDRIGRTSTLFIVLVVQSVILILFGFVHQPVLLLINAIVYAVTLWAIPTTMAASISDFIHPINVPTGIGFITLFFGIGQFISPIVISSIVDFTGFYFIAFIVSSIVCFMGGLGCIKLYMMQKTKSPQRKNIITHHINS